MSPKSIVLLLAGLASCAEAKGDQHAERPRESRTAPKARATRVEVAELVPSSPTLSLQLPGEVEGSRESHVASPFGGVIEKVHVSLGDRVSAGAPVAWVNRSFHKIEVDQATVEVERATSDLKRAERAGSSVSTARLDAARFNLRAAEARMAMADLRDRSANVRAPFGGTVASVEVEVGEVVPPAGLIAHIIRINPVHVSVTVSDKDIVSIEPGMAVTVDSGARAKIFDGKVASVSPAADMKTRAFEVLVEVPNPDRLLLPGMIATVRLSKAIEGDVLAIPQYVLVTRREGNGVFVYADGVAKWRVLKLGRVLNHQVLVSEGLAIGELIVVVGHRELADGDPLIIARKGRCCVAGVVKYEAAP